LQRQEETYLVRADLKSCNHGQRCTMFSNSLVNYLGKHLCTVIIDLWNVCSTCRAYFVRCYSGTNRQLGLFTYSVPHLLHAVVHGNVMRFAVFRYTDQRVNWNFKLRVTRVGTHLRYPSSHPAACMFGSYRLNISITCFDNSM
jgi:hypothetical protein